MKKKKFLIDVKRVPRWNAMRCLGPMPVRLFFLLLDVVVVEIGIVGIKAIVRWVAIRSPEWWCITARLG